MAYLANLCRWGLLSEPTLLSGRHLWLKREMKSWNTSTAKSLLITTVGSLPRKCTWIKGQLTVRQANSKLMMSVCCGNIPSVNGIPVCT